ncbi:hypothetical protein CQY20_06835 [Mycolicibacterium agri]|uniref:DUF4189 domain-containing protein n=1 Tax=Mycolicibacterium agri TaxID=36811 RepID=A0A2A7NB10_MYCAG|nr:DUF4189 domain-containing protein [Mycolicibacterium agri]PEG40641.1 hypothetical protein CQY20_06835 [Mycolicibacterium agri]GFG50387.1 hypothetical protein MAGR_18280 [Mycolicibacterium agri]
MTTTVASRARWRGRTIAASVLAAGAASVGLLATPAPAQAAPQYIALALGYVNENPPVTMAGGSAISASQEQAAQGALTNCSNNGGSHCVTVIIGTDQCAAAASNDFGERVGATAATRAAAESAAKAKLEISTGAKVIVSGCSNGNTPPPPPNDPPPPPAPKQGPTISFDKVLGGLEVHITDRSGVPSQCTYAMDNVNRSFALAANSTYNLRLVPLIPQFRDRTATVTCDNGTSTTATTFF